MPECPICGSPISSEVCALCGHHNDWTPQTAAPPARDPSVTDGGLPPAEVSASQSVDGNADARAMISAQSVSLPPRQNRRPMLVGIAVFVVAAALIGGSMALRPPISPDAQAVPVGSAATPTGSSTATPAPMPATSGTYADAYPDVVVPVGSKECARTGTGPYAAAGTANETTSCPFAINVRTAYLQAGLNGSPGHVSAYSPTTQQTYDMTCSGSQPVLCTGGVAGRVVLYGGRLVTR